MKQITAEQQCSGIWPKARGGVWTAKDSEGRFGQSYSDLKEPGEPGIYVRPHNYRIKANQAKHSYISLQRPSQPS